MATSFFITKRYRMFCDQEYLPQKHRNTEAQKEYSLLFSALVFLWQYNFAEGKPG